MGVDGLGLWFEVWGLGQEGKKTPRNEVKWTRVFPRGYLVLTDDWLVWLQVCPMYSPPWYKHSSAVESGTGKSLSVYSEH